MPKSILLLPAALLAACTASAPVALSEAQESDLARAIDGRIAGAPIACVNQRTLRGNRSIGEGVILFEGPGDILYVNRPRAGCPEITSSRALITRTTTGQLCSGDLTVVVDPVSNFDYGGCALGEFTPYRRPD